jgi:hypothetical protein
MRCLLCLLVVEKQNRCDTRWKTAEFAFFVPPTFSFAMPDIQTDTILHPPKQTETMVFTNKQKTISININEDNTCEALDLLMDPLKLSRVLSLDEFDFDFDDGSHGMNSPVSMHSISSCSWTSNSSDSLFLNPLPAFSSNLSTMDYGLEPKVPSSLPKSLPCFNPTDSDSTTTPTPERICYACKKLLSVDMFCNNQRRRKGAKARCTRCVAKNCMPLSKSSLK